MDEVKLAGRYLLESEIASGGMATVWLAKDEVLGRTVAAKILHKHLLRDETFRERFRIEALASARLSHPNIVAIFDTSDHEDVPFIVMEYLGGGTLRDLLASGKRLEYGRIASIGADVCDALAYAHEAGVVHRDIKPGNIFFSETGHVKVGDFGIAKAAFVSANLTESGEMLGTVRYLSPEQVEGIDPDGRSDLYSLGVVLYECVTSRQPFKAETDIATPAVRPSATPPKPRDVRPDVPRELDAAIMRALATSRDDRFASARQMQNSLAPIADHDIETVIRQPVSRPEVPTSFVKQESRWLIPTILIVLLAVGLVITVLQLTSGKPITDTFKALFNPGQPKVTALTIESAATFDPRPDGDGSENDDQVSLAFDGNVATHWKTAYYRTALFGQLKKGVGLTVDLGSPSEVKNVVVDSVTEGWDAMIKYSDDSTSWNEIGTQTQVASEQTFQVTGKHRYWMIWITKLVQTKSQGDAQLPYSVGISEVMFSPS